MYVYIYGSLHLRVLCKPGGLLCLQQLSLASITQADFCGCVLWYQENTNHHVNNLP